MLAFVHASATAVWPPTGIALAAILLLGYRVWPGVLLGAFLANMTTEGTVATSAGIAVGNTLEALVGAYLVNRFAGGRNVFERPQHILRFAVLAGMVSTLVSATSGDSLALVASPLVQIRGHLADVVARRRRRRARRDSAAAPLDWEAAAARGRP